MIPALSAAPLSWGCDLLRRERGSLESACCCIRPRPSALRMHSQRPMSPIVVALESYSSDAVYHSKFHSPTTRECVDCWTRKGPASRCGQSPNQAHGKPKRLEENASSPRRRAFSRHPFQQRTQACPNTPPRPASRCNNPAQPPRQNTFSQRHCVDSRTQIFRPDFS